MITSLSVDISNDPITGLKRRLFHHRLEINSNMEMVHYRKIEYYEKLPGDLYGRPILQAISENQNLTQEAKTKLYEKYQPQYFSVSTSGVYVDMATGQPVDQALQPDGSMGYPVGSVPELEFWQNLPISILQPAPTKNSEVVYGLIKMSMIDANSHGKL